MQPCNSECKCTKACDSDGRRDAEQVSCESPVGVVRAEVPNHDDRAVCLTANLSGKGGFSL